MSEKLDAKKVDAALKRAARKALHGTREERSGRFMSAPKAFISYSHDSPAHKDWVLKLGIDLRAKGVDVVLDQWDLVAGQDVSMFMQRGISEADRVIMICSSAYVTKSEQGVGGAGYERLIVTAEVVNSIDTIKFIPILRASGSKKTPSFLGPRMYIDFENDSDYELKLIELAREIHGAPAISKPPLGPNPFSGTPITSLVTGTTSPTDTSATDNKSLSNTWFFQEQATAQRLISKINLTGYMEIRANVLHRLSKSQIELLNAVKLSEIRTFGWPIGITLENREDNRKPNQIFFDTRVVRVTESLMFIESLYSKLGVPPEARIGIQITHGGLKGRELSSASSNRYMFSRGPTEENESTSEITTILGTMGETRVDDVRKIVEPMFMLFNFMQFNASVYDDIVRNFERGIIR